MVDDSDEQATSGGIVGAISRRRVLSAAAIVGIAGGANSLVGGQEMGEIELEGYTGGWEGVAPAEIEGQTNPTLSLEAGVDYTVTWTNEDGQPHNFVLRDADGNDIVRSDIIEEGSQTVEFTASEDMATYLCEVHPNTMVGDVETEAGTDAPEEEEPEEEEEEPEEEEEEPEEEEEEEEEPEEEEEEEEEEEPAVEPPREYEATLSGEPHGVETEASGEATFEVEAHEDGMDAHYEVTVENICDVTQAHIHLGAEGEDGPVVVWLYPEEGMEPELVEGRFSGTLAEGTITEDDFVGEWEGADFETAGETVETGGAYVNVHTEEHPGGEIRGQIEPVDGS